MFHSGSQHYNIYMCHVAYGGSLLYLSTQSKQRPGGTHTNIHKTHTHHERGAIRASHSN